MFRDKVTGEIIQWLWKGCGEILYVAQDSGRFYWLPPYEFEQRYERVIGWSPADLKPPSALAERG